MRYKKEFFFSCSHLAATEGDYWLEKESKRKTQHDGRVRSGHSSRGALTWNRVWRKKERKKGEIRGGQIARDRARARESVRVWRMKVSKVEGRSSALGAYSGNERSRDARR